MSAPFLTTTLGYPRLGENRQYKRLLEGSWSGKVSDSELQQGLQMLEAQQLQRQASAGIDLVCCGDFSPYDHVLDISVALGCLPKWLGTFHAPPALSQYFTLARGADGVSPLEMTKWFNTNYHYLVPELPESFSLLRNPIKEALQRGKKAMKASVKPWILGPFTFLRLSNLRGQELAARLNELTTIYHQMLQKVQGVPLQLIQVDEPALAMDVSEDEWPAIEQCYSVLAAARVPLCIQTYYDDVADIWQQLIGLPVSAIGVDLVAGNQRNLSAIHAVPFPADKKLVAGIVNGRNIWRSDLPEKLDIVQRLAGHVGAGNLLLSPSCSLLHLPETAQHETHLPEELHNGVCFAQERLAELNLLARSALHGIESVKDEWQRAQAKRDVWLAWTGRHVAAVRERVRHLTKDDAIRTALSERRALQRQRLQLPLLPTTTIGSFPQTPELRSARTQRAKDPESYEQRIQAEVERVIRLQEECGIDVLVDGEPDRNDMVQFFAEQLPGCASLKEGWVQSYGSRCVRPPVIYGDVWRKDPLTLDVSRYAQSLTDKPVKGMLTGPVTMLCWSFVREDIPREQVAYQLALAIRDEAVALEQEGGLAIIQIDEPAFREGLPLKARDQQDYLTWAVHAFRLASSGVASATQVHTHMCYAEFRDILPAIAALDADVISIEDARSHGEMLEVLGAEGYPGEVGPGVWDIHSPQVPSVEFIAAKLKETLQHLPPDRIWVNPDCGLKTRKYAEVIASLKNMVEAARIVRAEL